MEIEASGWKLFHKDIVSSSIESSIDEYVFLRSYFAT